MRCRLNAAPSLLHTSPLGVTGDWSVPEARKPLRFRRLWTAIGYVLIAFVVYSSLTPTPITIPVKHGDKYGHVLAYGALMFWFAQLHVASRARVLWACAFVAMGIALEFVAPPRSPWLLERIESRMF